MPRIGNPGIDGGPYRYYSILMTTTNNETIDCGYETVTIYAEQGEDGEQCWVYSASLSGGRTEADNIDCDGDAPIGEAVSAWLSEHVGYGGKTPTKIAKVDLPYPNSRQLVW